MVSHRRHTRKYFTRAEPSLTDIEGLSEKPPRIAQGSILEPDLLKYSIDNLLRLSMPERSRLVAALLAGRTIEQAQSKLAILMQRVSESLLMVSALHRRKAK